ncbi:cell wall hydrolase [Paracoccus salipaludis]|uniref:Cell wall hydrolase n=1 Tax=Paracoccus salipaludis TaxID=2032623 RepID=A0A2A2GHY3_9RHOB|nr:cell wall hydrolase [Paracoccus salipaludis]PAU96547.1 cell wall hydrolase [Paracoccus salipaludis]
MKSRHPAWRLILVAAAVAAVSGCGMFRRHSELECMERAMYFESNRSSRDGMVAVGSVVMNRVASRQYPNTVCGVVSQKNQFAAGVMTRRMDRRSAPLIREAATSVLRGERHPMIGNAQFFHAAGYRAGYDNMHYVLTAGGNAFYERRRPEHVTQSVPRPAIEGITRPRS